MAAVYLYDKPIPDTITEEVLSKFISMGFKEKRSFSIDNSHFLEADSGEQVIVDNEGIRFFPEGEYLEDVIEKTEFYRSILHKIDPKFKVHDDILMININFYGPQIV